MATKKAKKTSAKKKTTEKVVTTSRVVTKDEKKNSFANIIKNRKNIKDIDGIFSGKTISMLAVELIGTFIITLPIFYTSSLSSIYSQLPPSISMILILGVNFIVIFGAILAFGDYTKTFFNPIISFGKWIANKISGKKAILTMIAQLLGAMLASTIIKYYVLHSPVQVRSMQQANQAQKVTAPKLRTLYTKFTKEQLDQAKKNKSMKKQMNDFVNKEEKENRGSFVALYQFIAVIVFSFIIAQANKKDSLNKALIIGTATVTAMVVGVTMSGLVNGASGIILNPVSLLLLNSKDINFVKDVLPYYVLIPFVASAIGFELEKLLVKNITTKK